MSDRAALPSLLLWLRRHMSFQGDDFLSRIYFVGFMARTLFAVHAVGVNLILVLPRATNPVGVLAACVGLLYWHLFISLRLRRPYRRTRRALLADLGVTTTLIIVTVLVVPGGLAPLSLAGYWASGCAGYAAMFLGPLWSIGFSIVTATALLATPSHFALERLGACFVSLVLTASLAVLIDQFRTTIVEQEQERMRSAALAERERLARIVHDGALQVLALVEREGPYLGTRGMRLASLARESEAQLRTLLQDREVTQVGHGKAVDLAAALDKYESARVTVSTMASLVMVPRRLVDEVEAALTEMLKNVEKHAGRDAQVWILLDQEMDDEVILWVRDNGVGMTADQVQAAADKGRMGIRDSIVGRLAAVGGSAILKSSPGSGTEWELRFPLDVEAIEALENS
ncbi:sensor histidine kinase [Tessaracoccus defluvii]|uniref:Histidine kinase/HSP90-like ATPase domain-containing protein n=1 Tax=Tessaracoccus defluvii TaxID=1285901 RepID=A0A7H0H758_9ACTN|nr:ATP-binding protein [Tessaracoccus defluvii]QNP56374.1 hypothetical protein H9L22_02630 [Tessaracoccus defluvii]